MKLSPSEGTPLLQAFLKSHSTKCSIFVLFPVEFFITMDTKRRNKNRVQKVFFSPPCWGHLPRDLNLLKAIWGSSVGHLELLQLEESCWPFPGDQAIKFVLPRMPSSTSLSLSSCLQCHFPSLPELPILTSVTVSTPCIQLSGLSVSLNWLESYLWTWTVLSSPFYL